MSGRQRKGLGFSKPAQDEIGPRGYDVEDNDELDGISREQLEVLNNPDRIRDLEKQVEHIAASGQSDDFEGDIGPWEGTPIFPRLKSAWERGMKKRKQQSQGGYRSGGRF